MTNEIPTKYIKKIRRAYINPGLTYVLNRFCDLFLFSINVYVDINEDPEKVPSNLYKFLKICNSFKLFKIMSFQEIKDISQQRIMLDMPGEAGKVILTYEILIKDEVYLVYEIIKRSKPIVSVILTDILLNSAKLGSVLKLKNHS